MRHLNPLFSYRNTDTERDRDIEYRYRERDYREERDARRDRSRDRGRDRDRDIEYRYRERDYREERDARRDRSRDRGRDADRREKSSRGFDCFRQQDNKLLHKILKAFKGNEIPLISIKPELTKNYILNLAKENIKHLSTKNLDAEAIKNIQTSYYIISHPECRMQRGLVLEYLLETLFTPNFLLKDDYSIDENRLAIVRKDGSNFADLLLNASNMGFPLFQKFLSEKKFSSDPDSDQKIKQKLIESMIFSIPSTREDRGYSDRAILSTNQHDCLKNGLRLISEKNKENFLINILQNFAISQSRNIENYKYIDFVISTIKENITKDKWGDAIEKIFCTPSKNDNAINRADFVHNKSYLQKIKELIDETFRENLEKKEGFIEKLSANCDVDLKSRFDALPSANTYVRRKRFTWNSNYTPNP